MNYFKDFKYRSVKMKNRIQGSLFEDLDLSIYPYSIKDLKIEEYTFNSNKFLVINDIFMCIQDDISKDEIDYLFKYFPHILYFIIKSSKIAKRLNLSHVCERFNTLFIDGYLPKDLLFKALYYDYFYPSIHFLSDMNNKNNFNSIEIDWEIDELHLISKNYCLKDNNRYIFDEKSNYTLIYENPSVIDNGIDYNLTKIFHPNNIDKLIDVIDILTKLTFERRLKGE